MEINKFKRTKLACYASYFTMSSIFSLPPLLFVTLRETYGISYTLLGTLVLTNFCTQLAVDLVFTLFAKHFNVKKVIRIMPLITTLGLVIYALVPTLFPQYAYGGLLLGTVVFSVSAGLSEVLLSPVIAAIPSETPQRDMSLLHSLFAFGVFTVVLVSTAFLKIFGTENWMYLTLFLALWPVAAAVLFMCSPMPDMDVGNQGGEKSRGKSRLGLALCVGCIFFGSCAENAMSSWVSGYMEAALHIPKMAGDILGMAGFAILLGLTRIAYARWGKRIGSVLLWGMAGAAVCYVAASISASVVVAVVACIFTGMFTSMLWPGNLILMEENIPGAGVAAYALMAAGGDLGASVAPQLLGIVTDQVAASAFAERIALSSGMSAEQVGMKAGMLVSALFPLAGMVLVIFTLRHFRKGR
ncbi:MAG: MFS transporter [Clostridia bacterium]|nr:MFS transporter [Clostridia bacterium]